MVLITPVEKPAGKSNGRRHPRMSSGLDVFAIKESAIESTPAFMEDLLREDPDLDADQVRGNVAELVDLQREFRERFSWYLRLRDWLRDHRIRTHLVSGIEFQMAVFIVKTFHLQ